MELPMITLPLLAISLFVNVCLILVNQWMIKAWELDVSEKIQLCKQINDSWSRKYEALLEELEKAYDMTSDDLK